MKIHIITGHFYPQVHPRAFRANELALEFSRLGHQVTISNCWTIKEFDYQKYAKDNKLVIENLGLFYTSQNNPQHNIKKRGGIYKQLRFLKEYLFAGRTVLNAIKLAKRINIPQDVDAVIALSTPFTCILGLSYYLRTHRKTFVTIGDSGDPFYNSRQSPKALWFYYMEKKVYKSLDFLTIPTRNAIPIYLPMIPISKIRVIPQGFRINNQKLYTGLISSPVKFAYAGVFYWDIRNPEFLFKYLNTLTINFEFYIYLRAYDNNLVQLIESMPKIKSKIKIEYSVPREELIYKLSMVNFLINIENQSNTQIPSKLIDYAISERPIFSCKSNNFSPTIFNHFLEGNYERQYEIRKEDYDISLITNNFLNLIELASCPKSKF